MDYLHWFDSTNIRLLGAFMWFYSFAVYRNYCYLKFLSKYGLVHKWCHGEVLDFSPQLAPLLSSFHKYPLKKWHHLWKLPQASNPNRILDNKNKEHPKFHRKSQLDMEYKYFQIIKTSNWCETITLKSNKNSNRKIDRL